MSATPTERRIVYAGAAAALFIITTGGGILGSVVARAVILSEHKHVAPAPAVWAPNACSCTETAECKSALNRCGASWDDAFGGPHAGKVPNSQCEQQLAICHREWSDMFERQWAHDTDAAVSGPSVKSTP